MMETLQRLSLVHTNMEIEIGKAALLVLDMQKYFLEQKSHAYIPSGPVIIPVIQNLIDYFSMVRMPIFFTKHFNIPENAGMMGMWWKDAIDLNSQRAEIIEQLDISKGRILHKDRYDAFWDTNLDDMLKENGVEQVVITGVMTHLCCESTARSAFTRNYQVFFVIDGTATYTRELHMASLLTLSHGFAKPILSHEVTDK